MNTDNFTDKSTIEATLKKPAKKHSLLNLVQKAHFCSCFIIVVMFLDVKICILDHFLQMELWGFV